VNEKKESSPDIKVKSKRGTVGASWKPITLSLEGEGRVRVKNNI
jgi:hypothetical protein